MTVVDLKRFTPKDKAITYIRAYVELYNWRNCGQVYGIYKITKLEKMRILIIKNSRNFRAY